MCELLCWSYEVEFGRLMELRSINDSAIIKSLNTFFLIITFLVTADVTEEKLLQISFPSSTDL